MCLWLCCVFSEFRFRLTTKLGRQKKWREKKKEGEQETECEGSFDLLACSAVTVSECVRL